MQAKKRLCKIFPQISVATMRRIKCMGKSKKNARVWALCVCMCVCTCIVSLPGAQLLGHSQP